MDDTQDLAALDSLFHKYGASSSASKQKKDCSRDSSEISVDLQQVPTKSFLQEIQERAQVSLVLPSHSYKKNRSELRSV